MPESDTMTRDDRLDRTVLEVTHRLIPMFVEWGLDVEQMRELVDQTAHMAEGRAFQGGIDPLAIDLYTILREGVSGSGKALAKFIRRIGASLRSVEIEVVP